MKRFIFILGIAFLSINSTVKAQVGINTDKPDESAYLDISGSEKGLLPPRMTNAQRGILDKLGAVNGPATGLVIYNTDEGGLQVNKGTKSVPNWLTLGEGGNTPTPSPDFTWVYFPVTPISMSPTETDGTVSINLKTIYDKELGADGKLGLTYLRGQLEFVILGYDDKAFQSPKIIADANDANNLNILNFKPVSTGVSDASFFNVAIKIYN